MSSWHGAGGTLAVDPGLVTLDDLLAGDVVGDEVNEVSLRSRQDLLEGFQYQCVDEQVVHRGEVRSECHVVQIGVCLGGSEGCIHEFLVTGRIRGGPGFELLLEVLELRHGEDVSKPARSAVAEERNVAVAQTEDVGAASRSGIVDQTRDLAFSEVVSSAVRTELGDFFGEVLHAFGFEDEIKTGSERVVGTIISGVERVFAARSPVAWDSQCLADLGGCPLGHGFGSKNAVHMACFLHASLAAACTGRSAGDNGLDERPAGPLVHDRVLRDVHLEQGHGTLDVHTHRSRIDMGGGNHHAANRRAVSGVSVGIEHHIGDTWSHARVDGLLEAGFVEAIADGAGSDHGDGFSCIVGKWNEAGGFAGFMDGFHDCWWVRSCGGASHRADR